MLSTLRFLMSKQLINFSKLVTFWSVERSIGNLPSLFSMLKVAPYLNKYFTTPKEPLLAARWSDVVPLEVVLTLLKSFNMSRYTPAMLSSSAQVRELQVLIVNLLKLNRYTASVSSTIQFYVLQDECIYWFLQLIGHFVQPLWALHPVNCTWIHGMADALRCNGVPGLREMPGMAQLMPQTWQPRTQYPTASRGRKVTGTQL